MIGREYANVDIIPPRDGRLFNEMVISPWQSLRLSAIRSNAIGIQRLPREPLHAAQDAYFAVVLLAGDYLLEPLHKGKRISEIALRWGFNDLSHFSRAFRQRFGCAPREMVAGRE